MHNYESEFYTMVVIELLNARSELTSAVRRLGGHGEVRGHPSDCRWARRDAHPHEASEANHVPRVAESGSHANGGLGRLRKEIVIDVKVQWDCAMLFRGSRSREPPS
jgi:hypothetical protein